MQPYSDVLNKCTYARCFKNNQTTNMKKIILLPFILLGAFAMCSAQNNAADTAIKYDVLSFGLGVGFDYGGIGINATIYPQKNIGLFGGVGYALAGVGYNAGLKLRLPGKGRFTPFITGMYGYNAAIHVSSENGFGPSLDKIFYGPTAGIGFDLGLPRRDKTSFSFTLMIPFRSPDVDAYMTYLENTQGVVFKNKLPPIGISIGFTLEQL